MLKQNLENRGFTFIELLVVLVILTIIGATAASTYFNFYNQQQLDITVNEITQTLRKAQARSLFSQNNSDWGVYFYKDDVNEEYFFDFFKNDNYIAPSIDDCKNDPDFDCFVLPNNLEISEISLDGSDQVVFEKYSGITTLSDNSQVTVRIKGTTGTFAEPCSTTDNKSVAITITSLGKVEKCQ